MTMKRIPAALAALAVLAGAAWWGFGRYEAAQAPSYRTVALRQGEIVSGVSSTGTLTPVVNVQVGTPVSGIIKALYVDYNSPVKVGQPIAQIDPAIFQAQADQAKGNLLSAQANVLKAQATELDAKRTRERYASLVSQGLVARSDFDTVDTAYKTAQAATEAARAVVAQAKGSYDQARTNLDYSTIRSPVDGIVISRNVDVGQTVAASLQAPTLFIIAQDLARMEIDASVDEADVSRITEGTPVSFTVDAYPEARFPGRVTQIRNSPVTVQNVVTYVVVVAVDNADLRLKPGMTANVTFEVARKQCDLVAPNAALRFRPRDAQGQDARARQGEGQTQAPREAPAKQVYVLGPDGRPKGVRVRTGIGGDRETEIISNQLKPGDLVVVEQLGGKRKAEGGSGPGGPMGPRF